MMIRRPLLFALALALAAPSLATAGGLGFGVKAGVNYSSLRGDFQSYADAKNQAGFVAGPFLDLGLLGPLSVQAEALFSVQGAKLDNTTNLGYPNVSDAHIDLTYFEVPVLARYTMMPGPIAPFIEAGPSFGFKVSSKVKGTGLPEQDADVKSLDTGAAAGAGVRFGLGQLKLVTDLRYTTSLASITNQSGAPSTYNSVWTLSAGVAF